MTRRSANCSFCRESCQDVGPLVEGPGEVYICAECIELCQSIIEQEKRRRGRVANVPQPGPTPEVIRGRLNQAVLADNLAALGVTPELVRHVRAIGRVTPLDEETLLRVVPSVDFNPMEGELAGPAV